MKCLAQTCFSYSLRSTLNSQTSPVCSLHGRCRELMAISQRANHFLSPPPPLVFQLHTLVFELQRRMHSSSGKEGNTVDSILPPRKGSFDPSSWKTIDSRAIGIERSAIPSCARTVLNILQKAGYDAYLVGGCVRDLCLKRTPKDFDVITDATLKQVRKQFRHCFIVGRRFPICHVHLKDSIVEVSSFITDDDNVKNGKGVPSQISNRCTVNDYIRWKNCLRRDFTINCLFFDPIQQRIYDYVSGLKDLRMSKIRTVIPAHVSFEEDRARILRGLRIAARLDFQFSRETASAIRDFSSSILSLDASRLRLEMNFMLAYGAAESSIYALQKFKLLDILLPIQATYLADQRRKKVGHDFNMLMKLFSTADKYFTTDRPAHGKLWSAIMTFHLALVENPQDSLVVWTFSTILYRGTWNNAIEIAKQNERVHHVQFIPEIHTSINPKSDEEILEEVSHLALLIKTSVNSLTSIDALEKSLGRYGNPPSSRMLIASKKMGRDVSQLFDVLENERKSRDKQREGCQINYELLKKGDADEIRFVLGKIIMETMNSESSHGQSLIEQVQSHNHQELSSLFR